MTKTTTFVWDPVSDCLISELDGDNNVQAVYTNEPQQYGGVISQRRGTTTSTLHADALGASRALTDSMQATTDTYLYDAWGNLIASSGTTVNPFRWVGRYGYYTDTLTGLVYVRARMYQPTVARWCSVDPLALQDGSNLFSYVKNAMTMQIDASGRISASPADGMELYSYGYASSSTGGIMQQDSVSHVDENNLFTAYFSPIGADSTGMFMSGFPSYSWRAGCGGPPSKIPIIWTKIVCASPLGSRVSRLCVKYLVAEHVILCQTCYSIFSPDAVFVETCIRAGLRMQFLRDAVTGKAVCCTCWLGA